MFTYVNGSPTWLLPCTLPAGCVNTQKVLVRALSGSPPPPTMCAPHCCPTPEMSKEQWLFSFVQDSILHPPFPFFYSKINVPSPSSFWLAISNLLVCLLRGSCCTFVLRWSFRKWSFYMSFHGIGSNKLSFCHVIKNQPTKQQFWVQDSLKGILVPPDLP